MSTSVPDLVPQIVNPEETTEEQILCARQKVKKALRFLIRKEHFYSTILFNLDREAEPNIHIPTACTDGRQIWYSPQYVNKQTFDQTIGLMIHETEHITLHHATRMGNRNPLIWNVACDHVINLNLEESGYVLPDGALKDPQFKGMTAEQVYKIIFDEMQQNGQIDENGNIKSPQGGYGDGFGGHTGEEVQDPGQCGGVIQPRSATGEKLSKGELDKLEKDIKKTVAKAQAIAKRQGRLPAHIERDNKFNQREIIDYREKIGRFVSEIARTNYDWRKPNKRYMQTGFIIPSLHNKVPGNVAIATDTSGSMDEEMLKNAIGEVISCLEAYEKVGREEIEIPVISCDAAVKKVQMVSMGDKIETLKGGGGTDYIPVFKWLDKYIDQGNNIVALIYFTDGYCNSFPKEPEYPVMWGLIERNDGFKPPFGEVFYAFDEAIN